MSFSYLFPEQGQKNFLGRHLPFDMSNVTPSGLRTQLLYGLVVINAETKPIGVEAKEMHEAIKTLLKMNTIGIRFGCTFKLSIIQATRRPSNQSIFCPLLTSVKRTEKEKAAINFDGKVAHGMIVMRRGILCINCLTRT